MNILMYNGEGEEETHIIPSKMEVCGMCDGKTYILNRSIGEHAYSSEEFEEAFSDDEDREAYFTRGGKYDIICTECHGKNVVDIIDEEACTPEQMKIVERYYEILSDIEDDKRTYQMECGYFE